MWEHVIGIIAQALGPGSVVLIISLILTGKLRPKSAVDDMRKDMEAATTVYRDLAATWQSAYLTSEAARRQQEEALQELTELSRTSANFIQTLHKAVGIGDKL